MIKKIIITILIILIIASVGVIGYIIVSQNPNLKIPSLWPFGKSVSSSAPKVPSGFFPTGTTTTSITRSNNQNTANPNLKTPEQSVPTNPELNGTSAIGLSLIKNGDQEQVFFVDKPSGNIYEITTQNELARVNGETLNNIQEVYWGKDKLGSRLITRMVQFNQKMALSGLIKYASSTNLGTLSNQIIGTNISAVVISPDGGKLFTLEPEKGGVIGYIGDLDNKTKKKVWSFPIENWQVAWPKDNIISLITSPSAKDYGYLYFLNPTNGALTQILKGVNGLTASVAPDGQRVIYSRGNFGSLSLYSYDLITKKTDLLDLKTLPEKCLWADSNIVYCAVPRTIPYGLYPDNWYQSKITFADDIWKIDLKQKTIVLTLPLVGSYDLVNLVIAPKRGWLYAINKTDNTIQSFSLPME